MDPRAVFSSVVNKFTPKEKAEYFLAVKVSSENISATVWTIQEGKVVIGPVSAAELEDSSLDAVIKTADKAISQALDGYPEDVAKTIFALPDHWISEGKIVPEKLNLIHRLCRELDLTALGFVGLTESLASYYKEIEGAPLTAILVGFDNERSTLTMYRAGKDLGTAPLPLKENEDIPDEIEKALKRFTETEVLPSRMILYDGKSDLETITSKLTAHAWTQRLPFLHFPKVETVPAEVVIKAVAVAGGLELGGKFETATVAETVDRPAPSPKEETTTPELEEVSAQEAGFQTKTNFKEITFANSPKAQESPIPAIKAAPKRNFLKGFLPVLEKLISQIKKVKINLPIQKLASESQGRSRKNLLLPLFALIIFVVFILLAGFYFLPKADVIISVSAKNFDHSLDVAVTTTGSPATTLPTVPGDFLSVTTSGSKKGVVTGSKLVGDKAHGTVTIYNSTSARTFPAGTTLTANSLKFVTVSDVTVASGSGIASQATAQVGVTAADIGDSGNLPAGTLFAVDNLSASSYQGKNDAPLSGGSSHQATVVTQSDQSRLLATLSAELSDQAKADLTGKVTPGVTLLPNAITSSVVKKKFSKDVDAEAESLSLDLTLEFRGVVFSQDEMLNLFQNKFSSDIPSNYTLAKNNPGVSITKTQTDKAGNTVLSVNLSSKLTPQIDLIEVKNHLAGKSVKDAKVYLAKFPGVAAVKIDVTPALLRPLASLALPWKKDNLKVEIVSD